MHGKVTFFGTLKTDNYNLGVNERPPQRHRAHGGLTENYFLKRATESYFLIVFLYYYSRLCAFSVNSVSLW